MSILLCRMLIRMKLLIKWAFFIIVNELSGDILQNIKENQDNANELCKEIALKCFSLRSRWCLSIIAGEIDFYERGSTEADTAWGVIFKLYFRKVALLRCMVETRFATYNFYVTTYSVTKYPLYVFVGQNMNFDCTANLYAVVPIPANPSNLN